MKVKRGLERIGERSRQREIVSLPRETFDRQTDIEARRDNRVMLRALRAVVGNHWRIEGGDECGYDGRPWPCPDMLAVTEALGCEP